MKKKQLFWKDVSSVFGIKVIIYILSFFSSVFIARILGPEGKGVLAIVTSIYTVGIQLLNFGMHSANTYYISKNKQNVKKSIGNNLIIVVISVLLCSVVFVVINIGGMFDELDICLLLIAFLLIPIVLLTLLQKNIFIAISKIGVYNQIELLECVLYPILVFIVALNLQIYVKQVVICLLLAELIVAILSITQCRKIGIEVSVDYFKKLIIYGFKAYLSCLASYLVLKADIFMLDYFLNSKEVGYYSLSSSLAEMIYMVSSSVSLILFPHLGTVQTTLEKVTFIKKVNKVMIPIMMSLVLIALCVSSFIIPFLYGEAYTSSILPFNILQIGTFFWAMSSYYYSFFASLNLFKITIIAPTIGLVVNIILNIFLIPLMGIAGAAISSMICYILCFIIMVSYYNIFKKTLTRETEKDNKQK